MQFQCQHHLSGILNYSAVDRQADYERGVSDGSSCPKAAVEQHCRNGELAIANEVYEPVRKYADCMAREEQICIEKIREISQYLATEYPSQRDIIEQKYRAALERDEVVSGNNAPGAQLLARQIKEARAEVIRLRALNENRALDVKLDRKAYTTLMLGLAIPEGLVNAYVFQAILRSAPLEAIIVAVVLGCIVMFLAHAFGTLIRQLPSKRTVFDWAIRILAAFFALGLALVLIRTIALLRDAAVTSAMQGQIGTIGDALARGMPAAAPGQITAAIGSAIMTQAYQALTKILSREGEFIFFLALLFFLMGVCFAWLRHDPDGQYQKWKERYDRLERKQYQNDQKLAQVKASLAAERDEQLQALQHASIARTNERSELQMRQAALQDDRNDAMNRVKSIYNARVAIYRQGFSAASGVDLGAPPQLPP